MSERPVHHAPVVADQTATVARPKSRFWPNLRLIAITALVTSLGWIVLLGFADSDVMTGARDSAAGMTAAGMPPADRIGTAGADGPSQHMATMPTATVARGPAGAMRIPVAGVKAEQLVDTYTMPRGDRQHNAIDIIVPQGTRVVAAADGTVEKLFVSQDGGNTIYVRSPDGARMYYYAHLLDYEPGLAEGNFVRAGQPLGTVGATGNANPATPHLHFQIMRLAPGAPWWDGTPENPYPVLRRLR